MATVLSQSEIDALMNALTGGEEEIIHEEPTSAEPEVKIYDFKTANKFPKEQMRTLSIIFENFASLLTTHLSATLRTVTEIDVIPIEELAFSEFVNSMPTPVILPIFEMQPLRGQLLMGISPEIAYAMVGCLFGGAADYSDTSKAFTEIEMAIIERNVRKIMPLLDEAWARVLKVRTKVERIETSTQFAQILAMNETIAIVTLNVKIGNSEGLMYVCLPHLAVEPIAGQLNTRAMFSPPHYDDEDSALVAERVEQNLKKSIVTLSATFNETTATAWDILNLQVGDVIRIDHDVDEPIVMRVEHIPKFHGVIGSHKKKYAVQIIDVIEEGATE